MFDIYHVLIVLLILWLAALSMIDLEVRDIKIKQHYNYYYSIYDAVQANWPPLISYWCHATDRHLHDQTLKRRSIRRHPMATSNVRGRMIFHAYVSHSFIAPTASCIAQDCIYKLRCVERNV